MLLFYLARGVVYEPFCLVWLYQILFPPKLSLFICSQLFRDNYWLSLPSLLRFIISAIFLWKELFKPRSTHLIQVFNPNFVLYNSDQTHNRLSCFHPRSSPDPLNIWLCIWVVSRPLNLRFGHFWRRQNCEDESYAVTISSGHRASRNLQ